MTYDPNSILSNQPSFGAVYDPNSILGGEPTYHFGDEGRLAIRRAGGHEWGTIEPSQTFFGWFGEWGHGAAQFLNLRNLALIPGMISGSFYRSAWDLMDRFMPDVAELIEEQDLAQRPGVETRHVAGLGELMPGAADDTPLRYSDLYIRTLMQQPNVLDFATDMVSGHTRGIWGEDKPFSEDIQQYGRNLRDMFLYEPFHLTLDALIVADIAGAFGSAGLRTAGRGAVGIARNVPMPTRTGARLATAGQRMQEIAAGGTRAPMVVGNRVALREYSPNLVWQAGQRMWDSTIGANAVVDRATGRAFLPMDIASRALRRFGRAAEQHIVDSFNRLWFAEYEGITFADLATFNKEMRGLRPENLPQWRAFHLHMNEYGWDAAEVANILKSGQWLDGTRLTAGEFNALETAVRTTTAWSEILNGHRAIYRMLPGRYERWIENEVLGPGTEAVLRGRELLPAEQLGLGAEIETGRFVTRGQVTAKLEEEVIPVLEHRLNLERARAAELARDVEAAARETFVPEPRPPQRIEYKKWELGQPVEMAETRGWTTLGEWQAQQRLIRNGGAEIPIYAEGRTPIWEQIELGEAYAPLREAGGIEVVRDPRVQYHRERLFREIGWDAENELRYMVDDGTLDIYDRLMQPVREGIRVTEAEIDRLRAIDPGAPILALDPQQTLPFVEEWAQSQLRLRLIQPANPFTVREDMRLLSEHPELFHGDAATWISPEYYPHQLAEGFRNRVMWGVNEELTSIIRERPGFLETNEGMLFRLDLYDKQVERVLTRNINSVNHWEAMNGIISQAEIDFEASEYLATRHTDPRIRNMFMRTEDGTYRLRPAPRSRAGEAAGFLSPRMAEYREGLSLLAREGYTPVYFDGLKKLVRGGELQRLISDGIRQYATQYDAAGAIERTLADRIVRDLTTKSEEILQAGRPSVLPTSVVNHLASHFGKHGPLIEFARETAAWWRTFLLPFRFAWQIANATTNTFTTTIHGNIGGIRHMTPDLYRRAFSVRSGSVFNEMYGESMVYTTPFQRWLLTKGRVGEAIVRFNRGLHGMGYRFTVLNQQLDNMMHQINQLKILERDFRAGNPEAIRALDEVRAMAGRDITATDITQMESCMAYFGECVRDLYSSPLKPGTARTNYLAGLQARASECVYRYSAMTPWQRKYMSNLIPFSGWRLFTLGLALRFPLKYPGRAYIMNALAEWGQDYVDQMYEEAGVDPELIPEYDRLHGIPVLADGEGNVVTMRSSAFNLYDAMELESFPSWLASHPLASGAMEMAGFTLWPEPRTLSAPPEFGERGHGKNLFDAIGETLFAGYWDLFAHLIHPYKQYETGGVFQYEPRRTPGGELIPHPATVDILKMQASLTFTEYGDYSLMRRNYYGDEGSRSYAENYFDALDQLAQADEQDRGAMRARIGSYLEAADACLNNLGIMRSVAPIEDQVHLQAEYNRLMREIARVNMFKAILDNPEYEDIRIPPNFLHGQGWRERVD